MSALIQRGMYEQFAARHLAVKGPGALTNIEDGVMGTLPLDMSSDPAYWYLQGIRVFGARAQQSAGGAGTYSKIGLALEDAAEEVLVKVLKWTTDIAAMDLYRVPRTSFSSDPGIYGTGTDTRIPDVQDSKAVIISSNDNTSPGIEMAQWDLSIEQFMPTIDVPFIISPGQAFYMRPHASNTASIQNIFWAEIPAYKAEL